MGKLKDLSGAIFGKLTVIKRIEDHYYPNGRHDVAYLCRCQCGREVEVLGIHLRSGHTQSCGCFRKETTRQNRTKHGATNDPLYSTWKNIKGRCYNPNNPSYAYYGGRGIQVCEEWQHDYLKFAEWATSNGYDPQLSIDRIDFNGNYEPSNCRWVGQEVQSNNTRRNIFITFNNETHTVKEWSQLLKISYSCLWSRLKRGWPHDKALSTKPRAMKTPEIKRHS